MIYQLKLMLLASLIMIACAAAAMRTSPMANASNISDKAEAQAMECFNKEVKLYTLEIQPEKTKLMKRRIKLLKRQLKACNK